MEFIFGVLIALVVTYYLGYQHGTRNASKVIFKALGVPKGHRITSVSYKKVNR